MYHIIKDLARSLNLTNEDFAPSKNDADLGLNIRFATKKGPSSVPGVAK